MTWTVLVHLDASDELSAIPAREQAAVMNAIRKLEALGPALGYPHSSAIQDADRLRELRPRQGSSPWRAFYRQVGDELFVVAAIAAVKPRDFTRAVRAAQERLNDLGEEA